MLKLSGVITSCFVSNHLVNQLTYYPECRQHPKRYDTNGDAPTASILNVRTSTKTLLLSTLLWYLFGYF